LRLDFSVDIVPIRSSINVQRSWTGGPNTKDF
jgi:hypothetical protein